ncbi:Variant surface glycoprotein [Trypanosoma congolense IL3000]|uniref:Variant surface glycoprotein n=1 Tax=Trypanosoma congolense (strain IL3000) TaxID=1068625 RepID=F9W6R0_TRYCI|nr:Variant surface glycoprotein [Trypanosoma congolense IL3000]
MMLKLWMVFCLLGVGMVCVYGDKKNHNGDEHVLLCKVLRTAVFSYKSNSGSRAEAHVTYNYIGSEDEGDLETLKGTLPGNYDVQNGRNRGIVCGQPPDGSSRTGEKPRWPGHSAPHDLLCLCTVGPDGWPFISGTSIDSSHDTKLCGYTKEVLKAEGNKGWTINGSEGKDQMTATWTNVTKKCLEDDGQGGELKEALKQFIDKLSHTGDSTYQDMHRLGEGDFSKYPCGGNKKLCVMYYNSTQYEKLMPWWVVLAKATQNEVQKQEKKKDNKAENLKQNAQKQRQPQEQDQPLPQHEARTAALRSAPQDSQENEQSNPENFSSPLATSEETSGTFIIPPCTWFLGAFLML